MRIRTVILLSVISTHLTVIPAQVAGTTPAPEEEPGPFYYYLGEPIPLGQRTDTFAVLDRANGPADPRTSSSSWPLLMAFSVLSLTSLPCEGENVVLTEDFCTGVAGWTYADDLEGSIDAEPGAVMSWDPAEGNPDPGSLVLTTIEQLTQVEGYWALGPCMVSYPYETWLTRSMVEKTGSVFGHCNAYVSLFESPNCAGEGTITGGSVDVAPIAPDVWHSRQWSSPPLPSTRSARLVLLMSVSAGTAITCHFDSIVVTNDRSAAATDVPALSGVGLLIMTSVLVALAVAVLARGRVG